MIPNTSKRTHVRGVIRRSGASQIAFGSFICIAGFSLFLSAYLRIFESRTEQSEGGYFLAGLPYATIAQIMVGSFLLVAAILVLFCSTNELEFSERSSPGHSDITYRLANFLLNKKFDAALFLGGLAFLVGAAIFFVSATSVVERQLPTYEGYALAFAGPSPGVSASGQSQARKVDGAGSDMALPAAANLDAKAKVKDSTLLWWVRQPQPSPYAGLLPMLLGSALIVIFAILYPRIARIETTASGEVIQKLLVPALSFILFGVGVSEHVQAADAQRDERLVQQGLPPIHMLDREQKVRVLREISNNSPTLDKLDDALRDLIAQLRQKEQTAGGQNPELVAAIMDLRKALLDDQRSTSLTSMNTSLANISGSVESLQQIVTGKPLSVSVNNIAEAKPSLSELTNAIDASQAQTCALLRLTAETEARDATSSQERWAREKRHLGQRMYWATVGEPIKQLDANGHPMTPEAREEARLKTNLVKLQGVCPAAAPS